MDSTGQIFGMLAAVAMLLIIAVAIDEHDRSAGVQVTITCPAGSAVTDTNPGPRTVLACRPVSGPER